MIRFCVKKGHWLCSILDLCPFDHVTYEALFQNENTELDCHKFKEPKSAEINRGIDRNRGKLKACFRMLFKSKLGRRGGWKIVHMVRILYIICNYRCLFYYIVKHPV